MENKKDFLKNNYVCKYVEELTSLIVGKEFNQSYKIEHKQWAKQWKDDGFDGDWFASSLLDAKNKYWWYGGFDDNSDNLNILAEGLKKSLNSSEKEVFIWSVKVLEWGAVFKGSATYLINCYDNKILKSNILDAVKVLDGEDLASLDLFKEGGRLLMDSGMTKIYSLVSDKSIIFDSRVAAAMALIGHRLFSCGEWGNVKKVDFLAQSNGKRRVKDGFSPYNFKRKKSLSHARYNLLANWLIDAAIIKSIKANKAEDVFSLWGVPNDLDAPEKIKVLKRRVEAALFMIGSDVSNG